LLTTICVLAVPNALPDDLVVPPSGFDPASLAVNLQPYCLPERSMGNRNEAVACLNFLLGLNKLWFELNSRRSSEFCFSGKTRITGVSESGKPEKAHCAQIGQSMGWIIAECTNGTRVGGKNVFPSFLLMMLIVLGVIAVTGNASLRVVVEGR
jgi:hypothetical protein